MTTHTLVLGAAVSGRAAARLASRLGHAVAVYDRDIDALREFDEGIEPLAGEWDEHWLRGRDLVVTSPGIPPNAPPVVDSLNSGVEFISEMEFGFRHLDAACVAVTGTNGKTTVTAATSSMLVGAGFDAVAAGNIGLALSDVADGGHEIVVVEASSFQLQFVDRFHPAAAAILNIAPDHLDWHGTASAYAAAKRRIGERQEAADVIVYDADDAAATAAVAGLAATPIPVSGRRRPPQGNGPEGSVLYVGDFVVNRPPLDAAFTMDLTAAATLARHMGATQGSIAKVIDGFEPAVNRRTIVGEWDGVLWVNDSKATNPHAAAAAVAAYDSVVLIAGGRNKGLDLSPVVQGATISAVVAIGEAAGELAAATEPHLFHQADSIDEAIELADKLAKPGDTVLLAPGCASFDMFDNYKHRGRAFTDLVMKRKSN